MWLFKILFGFIFIIIIWHICTKKWLNPYKLNVFVGKKGSGKSTLLTKLAAENLLKGRPVYSTEFVRIEKHKGIGRKKQSIIYETVDLDPGHLYEYEFPPGSVLLIDEANLYEGYDNRQFKSMSQRTISWYRMQRHYKCTVYLFTQSWDLDKKIRSLTDQFWLVRKYFRTMVIARRVIMKPVIVHPQGDSAARIADDFVEDGILLAPFGGARFAYIPKWAKLFDSYKTDDNFQV